MHKYRITAVGAGALALLTVLGFLLHARAQTAPDQATKTNADQQYQRMLDEQDARFKRTDALLRAQEESHKLAVAMLTKQQELLKRQEEQLGRYDKILRTWESQQQHYQRYLDSLGKK